MACSSTALAEYPLIVCLSVNWLAFGLLAVQNLTQHWQIQR